MTVYAYQPWRSNAHLIRDGVVPLGYLRKEWEVLDPTHGTEGGFWTLWRPDHLEAHDIKTTGVDYRNLPREWKGRFDACTFDPRYKLNGRGTPEVDARYGAEEYASVEAVRDSMTDGLISCWYVTKPGGFILVKCQDQVSGGKVRWQTDWMTGTASALRMAKVDRFDMLRSRPQPPRTRKDGKPSVQQHARRNSSTLLVFQKPRASRSISKG